MRNIFKKEEQINYMAYKVEEVYEVQIEEEADLSELGTIVVNVKGLKERVHFGTNGETRELLALGMDTLNLYIIASDEKYCLTPNDLYFFNWKYGKKRLGPYIFDVIYPVRARRPSEHQKVNDNEQYVHDDIHKVVTKDKDESRKSVRKNEQAIELVSATPDDTFEEDMSTSSTISIEEKNEIIEVVDPLKEKLDNLLDILRSSKIKIGEGFEEAIPEEEREDFEVYATLWKKYRESIFINKEVPVTSWIDLKMKTKEGIKQLVNQLFQANGNTLLAEKSRFWINAMSEVDTFYRFAFEAVCIHGLDGGQLCNMLEFMKDDMENTIQRAIKEMNHGMESLDETNNMEWFVQVKQKWLAKEYGAVSKKDEHLKILSFYPWSTEIYWLFAEKFLNEKGKPKIIDKFAELNFFGTLAPSQVLKLFSEASDYKELKRSISKFKRIFIIYDTFRRADALDRYQGYFITLGEIESTGEVKAVATEFLNKAKDIVSEGYLTPMFVVVLVQCLVLGISADACSCLLDFESGAYSDDLIVDRFKSAIIPKIFKVFNNNKEYKIYPNREEWKSYAEIFGNKLGNDAQNFEKECHVFWQYYRFYQSPYAEKLDGHTLQEVEKYAKTTLGPREDVYRDLSRNLERTPEYLCTRHTMLIKILRTLKRSVDRFDIGKVQYATIIYMLFYSKRGHTSEHRRILARVFTGAGKSFLVAILAAFCVKFYGQKVDVLTSSTELIGHPVVKFSKFFNNLGITFDALDDSGRSVDGDIDILYSTMPLVIKEQLNDNTLDRFLDQRFGRRADTAVIDEVDNMLYDRSKSSIQLSNDVTSGLSPLLDILLINIYFEVKKGFIDFVATDVPSEEYDDRLLEHIQSRFCEGGPSYEKIMTLIKELNLPNFLLDYQEHQWSSWVANAVKALLKMNEGVAYHRDTETGQNIKIDATNTGLLQRRTHLANGLQQFLALKEGALMPPLSLTSGFRNIASFFNQYSALYGVTGTLGDEPTRKFLQKTYKVDTIDVKSQYKHCALKGDQPSGYRCYEFKPLVLSTRRNWLDAIFSSVEQQLMLGRPVLVFCQSPRKIRVIQKKLRYVRGPNGTRVQVHIYDATNKIIQQEFGPGDLILATNIASRGVDFKVTDTSESLGGLHICLSFLPATQRVEKQCIGRTSRGGKRGTAQLILLDSQNRKLDLIKAERDARNRDQVETTARSVLLNEQAQYFSDTFQKMLEETIYQGIRDAERKKKRNLSSQLRINFHLMQQEWSYWMQQNCFKESLFLEDEKEIEANDSRNRQQHTKLLKCFQSKEFSVQHDVYIAKEIDRVMFGDKDTSKSDQTRKLKVFFKDIGFEDNLKNLDKTRYTAMAIYYYIGYCVMNNNEKPGRILKLLKSCSTMIKEQIAPVFGRVMNSLAPGSLTHEQYSVLFLLFSNIYAELDSFRKQIKGVRKSGDDKIEIEYSVEVLNFKSIIGPLLSSFDFNRQERSALVDTVSGAAKAFGLYRILRMGVRGVKQQRRTIIKMLSIGQILQKLAISLSNNVVILMRKSAIIRRGTHQRVSRVKFQLRNNEIIDIIVSTESPYAAKLKFEDRLDIHLASLGYEKPELVDSRELWIENKTKNGVKERKKITDEDTEKLANEMYETLVKEDTRKIKKFTKEIEIDSATLEKATNRMYGELDNLHLLRKEIRVTFSENVTLKEELISVFIYDYIEEVTTGKQALVSCLNKIKESKRIVNILKSSNPGAMIVFKYIEAIKDRFLPVVVDYEVNRKLKEFSTKEQEFITMQYNSFIKKIINVFEAGVRKKEKERYQKVCKAIDKKQQKRFEKMKQDVEQMSERNKATGKVFKVCPYCSQDIEMDIFLDSVANAFNFILVFVHFPVRTQIFTPELSHEADTAERVIFRPNETKGRWTFQEKEGECLLKLLLESFPTFNKTKLTKGSNREREQEKIKVKYDESLVLKNSQFCPWYRYSVSQKWKYCKYTDPASDQLVLKKHQPLKGLHGE